MHALIESRAQETRRGEQSFFDGGLAQYIGWKILGTIVTAVTFGLAYPLALTMIYGWKINHTVIEGRRLRFTGSAVGLFGHWIKWWLLTLITFGIYGFWVFIKLEDWKVRNTSFTN
ncbi:hypothetical protein SAMN04488134_10823 [Amphibacillus marinus]|uniref:DUF898 domain-containing protein n=1 Tax=Amphibacillus marinus TaxID=872970 RepID=A0A1H8Q388_9BACI|nr:hypothetical protein [Amphibacillus marinus]SEO48546.1 hypothetical protein SAMN04488134_10823 [Amphibacillus marinus]